MCVPFLLSALITNTIHAQVHYWLTLLSLGACARVTVVVLCLCVCLCVCYHAIGYIPGSYMFRIRRHTVSWRLLKIIIVWISLKTFPLGDMVSYLPAMMIGNSAQCSWHNKKWHIVYELLVRSDDNLN